MDISNQIDNVNTGRLSGMEWSHIICKAKVDVTFTSEHQSLVGELDWAVPAKVVSY